MKKPSIPALPAQESPVKATLAPMKEILEQYMGVRGAPIKALPTTASLGDVIAKVNEILNRLQVKQSG